MHYG
jgi:transcriptional regulator GlxA family with amidase domain